MWNLQGFILKSYSPAAKKIAGSLRLFVKVILYVIQCARGKVMTPERKFEKLSTSIVSLSKSQLKQQIRKFKGGFNLDFTDSYLENLSVDRLRHILLAAMLTKSR